MENHWLDIQHRGYSAYLQETENADVCKKLTRAIVCADRAAEEMSTVFLDCEVKTDWIERIEAALPFIGNAVRENRQFILRHGETVPIEKAKRVSKASVEHLSRHSELITKEPRPEEDLIPDKIYMTENIGTYTVYENRFLYMLLCYLRDFVGFRYKKITESAASFSSDITVDKEFSDGTRKISYCLSYREVSQGMDGVCDPKTEAALSRIREILQTVEGLMRTDLMKEVSASPMLKPPITRTNVLLHNPNFKAAFELYAFLCQYTQDGYETVERYRDSGGFSDDMRWDFASLMAMTSYLSYRCGGLREALEERFLAEEKRRKEQQEQALKEKLAALKERIGQIDGAAFAYILALEERAAQLEDKADMLLAEEALRLEIQSRLEAVTAQIEPLQAEIKRLETALGEKIAEHHRLSEQHAREMHDARLRLEQEKARYEEAQQRFDAQMEQQKQEYLREYEALAEKYRLANARNHAIAQQQGQSPADEPLYTKEAFAQLEAEYEAFKRFFHSQWKIAKKQIRKDQLWRGNEK